MNKVLLKGLGSISPLGSERGEVISSYRQGAPSVSYGEYGREVLPRFSLKIEDEEKLTAFSKEEGIKSADRSALFSLFAAREAYKEAAWSAADGELIGIFIGSARGATESFENYHTAFLNNEKRTVSPLTSPITTMGSLATIVGRRFPTGAVFSQSMTCASAFAALSTAYAFIKSGMGTKFLAGGVEAPLTDFTVAQAEALTLYSHDLHTPFPCRPLAMAGSRENTMVLGEGGAVFALEGAAELCTGDVELLSFGFANEHNKRSTGISSEGVGFGRAMRDALNRASIPPKEVDAIILHAPGTSLGDASELRAVHDLFKGEAPLLLSNKFLTGHTYGASGAFSLEYAVLLLRGESPTPFPYPSFGNTRGRSEIRRVLINTSGFGGVFISLLVGLEG